MIFEFGEFELDESLFELRRRGERLAVQPKVLQLLLHLVKNRDRVVSAEELRQTLWPDQVVVGKSSLDRAVYGARRALGDDGTTQTIVRTVNRHGYHFAALVTHRHAPSTPSTEADALSRASREALGVAAAIGHELSLIRPELSNAQHEALTRRIAFALVQWHERERSKAS